MAESGDCGPLWLRADEQISGRGRRGREWSSPKGNLYCTGLFPYEGSVASTALLSFVASLAVYDLVSTYVEPDKLSLKWPNDVLINAKKCSGILLESGVADGQKWVAIGIGVNLLSHPAQTEFPATHILENMNEDRLTGPEPLMTGPEAALAILASRFESWKQIFEKDGFAPIREVWLARAGNVPGPVTVRLPKETFVGQALGLGENGELQVQLPNGKVRDVHAGDVFFGPQDEKI